MKKLSALIMGICLIGFMSTNASAACDCGYIWELGPGTIVQHVNLATNQGLDYTVTSACGTYGFTQAAPGPDFCISNQYTPIVVEYPSGNAKQSLVFAMSPFGTGTFSDYVNGNQTADQCAVTLTSAKLAITNTFYPGDFSSTQTNDCDVDFGAYLTVIGGFNGGHDQTVLEVFDGYVTADPSVGVEVVLIGRQTAFIPDTPSPGIAEIVHAIDNLRVEYYSRLKADINGDGTVDVADYNDWKTDLFKTRACSCFGYFQ